MERRIGIVGTGVIGGDLGYAFAAKAAAAGGSVTLFDTVPAALAAAQERIAGYAQKAVARSKLSPRAADALTRSIVLAESLEALRESDLVVEATKEDLSAKRGVIAALEAVVGPECLIASTTSGLCRSWLAEGAKHPGRVIVAHPFTPAWRSPPVELVADPSVAQRTYKLLVALGKVPIRVADVPCFAADDIFCCFEAEAVRLLADGVASVHQIDAIVNAAIGGGGPFLVHDLTKGNAIAAHCLRLMQEAHGGNTWFAPPSRMVEQGPTLWLTEKTDPDGNGAHDQALTQTVMDRILAVLLARTVYVLDNNICNASNLNWLTENALGFRGGLVTLLNQLGITAVRELCRRYQREHSTDFEIPAGLTEGRSYAFLQDVTTDIEVTAADSIAVVTVRRPEKLNALRSATIRELTEALNALDNDDTVKGVVLTGFGGALAGADISELAAQTSPEACTLHAIPGQNLTLQIARMKKPVVAALDGPTLGGGCEISMACWARVVGPNALIGQPEVNLGLIPGYGGTQRLPRLVGFERGMQMLRTGKPIKAPQAVEFGWASELAEDPVEAAKALLRRHFAGEVTLQPLSEMPFDVPSGVPEVDLGHLSRAIDAILVATILKGLKLALPAGLEFERQQFGQCHGTEDMGIGLKNFLENGPKVTAPFVHR